MLLNLALTATAHDTYHEGMPKSSESHGDVLLCSWDALETDDLSVSVLVHRDTQ